MLDVPVLWWLPLSHYNEKVCWYLDVRGIPHRRRAFPPFVHAGAALALTRGACSTMPVMRFADGVVAESAPIVARLERDAPALSSPRSAALEAEFDVGVGVWARHVLHHHNLKGDPMFTGLQGAAARAFLRARLGIGPEPAGTRAWAGVLETFDRIEAELGGGDHLVGDTLSVADITAAALLYPLVLPPEGPQGITHAPSLQELMATVDDRRAVSWVRETYARYRPAGA